MNREKIAKNLVENQLLKMDIDIDGLVLVWSCYILGNSKYIFAVPSEALLFEVTYNKEKNCYYIDRYKKQTNTVVYLEDNVERPITWNDFWERVDLLKELSDEDE